MKVRLPFLLLIYIMLMSNSLWAQRLVVSGWISDEVSGIHLPQVMLIDSKHQMAAYTDENGYFTMSLPFDSCILSCVAKGYIMSVVRLRPTQDIVVHIKMTKAANQRKSMEEPYFIIPGRKNSFTSFSYTNQEMKVLPQIVSGDLLKNNQYQAGFQQRMIGSSIQNVRGCGFEQQMVAFDGVPIYHPYHLLGVYSVFDRMNSQSVTSTRSDFDSKYSGGLSSQILVNSKSAEGINHGSLGFDALFLKGGMELKMPGKSSLIASYRRSYIDGLINLGSDSSYLKPLVFDFHIKYSIPFKSGSKFEINTMQTGDVLASGNTNNIVDDNGKLRKRIRGFDVGLRNRLYQANFQHIYRKSILMSYQVYYISYTYSSLYHVKVYIPADNTLEQTYNRRQSQGIKEIGARYILAKSQSYRKGFNLGLHLSRQQYDVGTSTYDKIILGQPQVDSVFFANKPTHYQIAPFINGFMPLSKGYILNYGLRGTLLTGYSTFVYADPHVSVRKQLDSSTVIEFNYDMMHQSYHILSQDYYGYGLDNMVPASKNSPVQRMSQFNFTLNKKLNQRYQLYTSIYYRHLVHQTMSKPGSTTNITTGNWDDITINGKGNIFGLEATLKKMEGLTTGWISYGYIHSRRIYSDLNDGESFPFYTDRSHTLNIVIINRIGKRNFLTFCYSIMSGNPITPPVARYQLPQATGVINNWSGQAVAVKEGFNTYRTPFGSHIDLAYQVERRSRWWKESSFHFSIYNLLNKLNAYDIRLEPTGTGNQLDINAYRLFSFVPTISYFMKF